MELATIWGRWTTMLAMLTLAATPSVAWATAWTTARATETASATAVSAAPASQTELRGTTIYGRDKRRDFHEIADPTVHRLARASAALVERRKLRRLGGGWSRIEAETLKERFNLCDGERFAAQPTAAECSSVLIGTDRILTAAHCIDRDTALATTLFVFDYHQASPEQDATLVRDENIYAPSELLYFRSQDTPLDYAIFKLDRPVRGRRPVRIAESSALRPGESVYMIGHPSGLPQKWTPNARVRQVQTWSFLANLDAFAGNSGSPVFHARTGGLVGLLNDGDVDYVRDPKRGCFVAKRCPIDGCLGETVIRIDRIVRDVYERSRTGAYPPLP